MDLIEEEIQKIKIMQVRVNHRLKKGVSSEKQDYRLSLLEVLSKIAKKNSQYQIPKNF
ncbi:hypothetical protein X777_11994 [Ooceraea biroi]|uniref:Uncharacterized protein n=1 Tax=Ooceraea biroi TaxID=2015173 RepID=A0A026WZ31_OOCBI|nr:hypothetical protein X777_11994 [Ooceraea biroi]